MKAIIRPGTGARPYATHIAENDRPLCGGGKDSRAIRMWQEFIGGTMSVTCAKCLQIAAFRKGLIAWPKKG